MFEAPITSTQTLPLDLKKRWLVQKQQAELFACSAYGGDPCGIALKDIGLEQYATRVETCADHLKFLQFGNYHKFHSAQFCRVRGCPICEQARLRQFKGKLVAIEKIQKTEVPVLHLQFSFAFDWDWQTFRSQWGKLYGRKEWKLPHFFRWITLCHLFGQWQLRVDLIALKKKGGKNYLPISTIRSVTQNVYGSQFLQVAGHYYLSVKPTLSLLSPLTLFSLPLTEALYLSLLKNQLYSCSSSLNQTLQAYHAALLSTRKKQNKYPSIASKIDSLNPKHYVYQPNPEHYQHDNDYLAWDLQYPLFSDDFVES